MTRRSPAGRSSGKSSQPTPFSQIPSASRALVVAVVTLAVVAASVGRWDLTAADWFRFGLILILGVASSVLSRGFERIRRALGEGLVPDLHGAWVVTAAVVLPPPLIGLMTAALFLAEVPVRRAEHRRGSARRQPFFKILYTVASVALPAVLAHATVGWSDRPIMVVAVISAIIIIGNNGLILAAISLSGQRQKLGLFTDAPLRQLVDVLSTVVGATLGAGLLSVGTNPSPMACIVVLGIPALLAMQFYSVTLEAAQPSVVDSTTGLICAGRLTELAELQLEEYRQSTVILVQVLDETPANLRAAAGILRGVLQARSGPPALLGRTDVATFALLLVGDRPQFGAWTRTKIHDQLTMVCVPHLVAMGYPQHPDDQFHDIVMRVGGLMVSSLPTSSR